MTMSSADPRAMRAHWTLDSSVVFLNHGSFGACPRVVLDAQRELRERLERNPMQFFIRDLEPLLDDARAELARFVGADPLDLVFVPNATAAVNAVVASFPFEPGDEALTTSQEYNACRNALEHAARRAGARVVAAEVPFPVASDDEVVNAILAAVGPRTRLALVDHITSPTGLVWPIARIVRALEERGVRTLVDGAHAPGMVPLALGELGASYYTGNCHKWLCAPKGAALLWVRRELQDGVVPAIVSHGLNATRRDRTRFHLLFDWTGTSDPTAVLCVPAALRFLESVHPGGGGIAAVMEDNRRKALDARDALALALGVALPAPASMIGSLAALPLPDGDGTPSASPLYTDRLTQALVERHRIEVPIVPWPSPPKRLVRISAQLYNAPEEYAVLARALGEELRAERGG